VSIPRRQSLLAKVEAVPGTDPTPVGADAVPMIDGLELGAVLENGEIVPVDAYLDGYNHVEGTIVLTASFSCMLKGSGAAGTAPEIAPLLRACGMAQADVVGPPASNTFTPDSVWSVAAGVGYQSATLYIEDGTHQWQMHGCYGTWSIDSSIVSFPKISFEFTGLYEKPTDQATITTPTYDATRPVACRGLTYNIGGSSARCTAFRLDLNREVHIARSQAAAFGVVAIELGACNPKGTWSIQEETIATHDWWGALEAGTVQDFSWVWGGAAGNIVTLARPAGNTLGGAKFSDLSRGEDNGVIWQDFGFSLGRHAGDDSFSLAFT